METIFLCVCLRPVDLLDLVKHFDHRHNIYFAIEAHFFVNTTDFKHVFRDCGAV